jgi:hypothetical protein
MISGSFISAKEFMLWAIAKTHTNIITLKTLVSLIVTSPSGILHPSKD